jgi:hypothetical protein
MNVEQILFVERLTQEGGVTRDAAALLTKTLGELAAMHLKLSEIHVNEGLSPAQEEALEAIEDDIRDVVRSTPGLRDAVFLYDPRGTTVGVHFLSGASNSLTGAWKIPIPDGAVAALAPDFWKEFAPSTGQLVGPYRDDLAP